MSGHREEKCALADNPQSIKSVVCAAPSSCRSPFLRKTNVCCVREFLGSVLLDIEGKIDGNWKFFVPETLEDNLGLPFELV